LGNFINEVVDQFDLGKCNVGLNDISCSFFKESYETEDIKNCMRNISQANKKLEIISNTLIRALGKKDVKIYIDGNHKTGYIMHTTLSRGEVLKKTLKDGYHFKMDKTKCCITSDKINELFHIKIKEEEKIKPLIIEQFKKTINEYYSKYADTFKKVHEFIANIDCIKSKAKVASQYKYTKPIIEKSAESYFMAIGLRHPIIEQLNLNNGSYIPNNVSLDEINNGILLYGVNGAGKSCYSKAIGLCIILAQSGHYVPADELKLGVFNKLYTRISDNDNIYKGQSSFFVEMSELKSIIHYADSNSIVLGDEVCKGTEDVSAVSIVSSTLKWLLDRNSKFVFATHLHNLTEVSVIKNHPKLSVKHLAVECNKKSDIIEFTRELKDGKGDCLYGVEIAKAVLDSEEFIKQTITCRNEILKKHNKLISNKKSRYNSSVLVDKCEIPGCNSTEQLDSHHIVFQSSADAERMNVHNAGNLVILCKTHHQDVHNGNIKINKWKHTTKGKVLDYKIMDKT
jgi:DNA mismatch repair protein MutS